MRLYLAIAWLCCFLGGSSAAHSQDQVQDVLRKYAQTLDHNSVTELFTKVEAGEISLEYDAQRGYLTSLLAALDIPVSSQTLVFSKTSLQAYRISPQNPRAIYFNDDVYVGWVQGSSLLEISTTDPLLGAAFYTIQMTPRRPVARRQNNQCLACHLLPMTQDVPGHAVRSVLTRKNGNINSLTRSFVTGHSSPIAERWGGWYVTGDAGEMQHMGNAFLEGDELVPQGESNRLDLREDFDTTKWPSAHSDIVALMVLEHQTQMQNTFTRANRDVQNALLELENAKSEDAQAGQELDAVVDQAAKLVVDYMLFSDEAKLTSQIRGSTSYAAEFAQRGPHDSQGRSLRDFDLKTRLFRYPCSYLIYTSSFASLEERLQQQVYLRLWKVLTNQDVSPEYAHLSEPVRAATLEILKQTKQDLPDYWLDAAPSSP